MIAPVVISQLAPPKPMASLGGVGCGDYSVAMICYLLSDGHIDLRSQHQRVPDIVRRLAAPLRKPQAGLNADELARAVAGLFERADLPAPKVAYSGGGQPIRDWPQLMSAVRDGAWAILGVWYPVIDRLAGYTGQAGLQVWHWIVVGDPRRVPYRELAGPVPAGQDPEELVSAMTVLDPLCNGRRPGVAKGPQTVAASVLRLAAGKVGTGLKGGAIGESRWTGVIGWVSQTAAAPPASPKPVPAPVTPPVAPQTPLPLPVDPCASVRDQAKRAELRLVEVSEDLIEARRLLDLYEARLDALGALADEPIDPEIADGTGGPEEVAP